MEINFDDPKQCLDEFTLGRCLIMAQQSLPPDYYDKFIDAYNLLIKQRNLGNKIIPDIGTKK